MFDIDRLKYDLKLKFGIESNEWLPLEGGFMNLKWRVDNQVIKVFSRQRYNDKKMHGIETALQHQHSLYFIDEVAKLYPYEHKMIQEVAGIEYMVMDYYQGKHLDNHLINTNQMYNLGRALSQIHAVASRNHIEPDLNHFKAVHEHIEWLNHNDKLPTSLADKRPLLNQCLTSLNHHEIHRYPIGITHSDCSDDNIIFDGDEVKLIDFDRCRISYVYQDIGRLMMSFAFDGQKLDRDKVDAFILGYNTSLKCSRETIKKSLIQTWIVEVPFWKLPGVYEKKQTSKLERFKREIEWLSEHFTNLEEMIF